MTKIVVSRARAHPRLPTVTFGKGVAKGTTTRTRRRAKGPRSLAAPGRMPGADRTGVRRVSSRPQSIATRRTLPRGARTGDICRDYRTRRVGRSRRRSDPDDQRLCSEDRRPEQGRVPGKGRASPRSEFLVPGRHCRRDMSDETIRADGMQTIAAGHGYGDGQATAPADAGRKRSSEPSRYQWYRSISRADTLTKSVRIVDVIIEFGKVIRQFRGAKRWWTRPLVFSLEYRRLPRRSPTPTFKFSTLEPCRRDCDACHPPRASDSQDFDPCELSISFRNMDGAGGSGTSSLSIRSDEACIASRTRVYAMAGQFHAC